MTILIKCYLIGVGVNGSSEPNALRQTKGEGCTVKETQWTRPITKRI